MATITVTKPTLTYFNVLGQAEVARLILEDAGVDYDFVPIPNWSEIKAQYIASGKTPFGQLPLYEEPGLGALVQSNAIARYLANKHGYAGSSAHEAARIDQAFEGVTDIKSQLFRVFFQTEESKKGEALKKLVEEFLPAQLAIFSKLLENNGNNGFLVGNKLSYADLGLYAIVHMIYSRVEEAKALVEKYPAIKSFLGRVANRERIRAYLARDVYAKK